MRERKRELVGRVVSDKMDKTVVVAVQTLRRHRLYQRTMRRTKKYMVHSELNEARTGDLVRIQESRPISRHKHWRVMLVMESAARRGKAVAEVTVVPEAQEELPEVIEGAVEAPGTVSEDEGTTGTTEEGVTR